MSIDTIQASNQELPKEGGSKALAVARMVGLCVGITCTPAQANELVEQTLPDIHLTLRAPASDKTSVVFQDTTPTTFKAALRQGVNNFSNLSPPMYDEGTEFEYHEASPSKILLRALESFKDPLETYLKTQFPIIYKAALAPINVSLNVNQDGNMSWSESKGQHSKVTSGELSDKEATILSIKPDLSKIVENTQIRLENLGLTANFFGTNIEGSKEQILVSQTWTF